MYSLLNLHPNPFGWKGLREFGHVHANPCSLRVDGESEPSGESSGTQRAQWVFRERFGYVTNISEIDVCCSIIRIEQLTSENFESQCVHREVTTTSSLFEGE